VEPTFRGEPARWLSLLGIQVPSCRPEGVKPSSTVCAEMYNFAVPAYALAMSEITVSQARARLADVVDAARVGHDPVYLTRRGQRVAAVIDAADLDLLIAAAEDLADIEAAAAARAEMDDGEPAIPWEQVKADLGLA
jgi:antitoxin Phd